MALFKIYRGLEANLPVEMHDGYAYFCSDSAAFFIDFSDSDGNLHRKQLNAKDAETLSGASLATILQSSEVEIPTSKAVFDALESKQNKLTFDEAPTADSTNPVTSGGVYAARSDWNQNDESAPDYVKNRTHYKELIVKELFQNTLSFEVSDGGAYSQVIIDVENIFTVGDAYFVNWDGVEYTCIAGELSDGPMSFIVIGNQSLLSNDFENSEEPFLILSLHEYNMHAIWSYADFAGSHTVSIKHEELEYFKLDKNYLPENDFVVAVKIIGLNTDSPYIYSIDKTYTEIETAYNNGMNIYMTAQDCTSGGVAYEDKYFLTPYFIGEISNDNTCIFVSDMNWNPAYVLSITISEDGYSINKIKLQKEIEGTEGQFVMITQGGFAYPYTPDEVPTADSINPINSGAVYTALTTKQNTITGTQGQVIGFDADGNAIAQDMPSSMPSVTTSDNGKFLRVVDGAWAATGASSNVYTATIGTNWTEDSTTGVKSQTVAISGITAKHTAKVDCVFAGNKDSDGYAAFVEQQNQYLEFITNGYAETVEGGITFYIFGDPNTVSIPIVVEVV